MGGAAGEDAHDHVLTLDHAPGLAGVRQHLQQGAHVLVVRDRTDGVDGAGIAVEQARAHAAHQAGVTAPGLELLDQNGFVGERDHFQVDAVFQRHGALLHGRLEHRPVASGDIPDAYLAVQGGARRHLVDAHQLGDGAQPHAHRHVAGIKNIRQGADQFLVNVHPGEQLFHFLLLLLRQAQLFRADTQR